MAEQTINTYVTPPGLLDRKAQQTEAESPSPVWAGFIPDTKQVTQMPGASGWAEVSVSQEPTRPCGSNGQVCPCLTAASARGLWLLFTLVVGRVKPLDETEGRIIRSLFPAMDTAAA